MKCIVVSVFNQVKYVDMLYLFLESLFIYGNLDENTHIIIYTSTPFINIIKRSHLFIDEKIKFEINDTYDTVDKTRKELLDVPNLPSIANYNKILCLNADNLVKDDINTIFDVCEENLIYILDGRKITNVFNKLPHTSPINLKIHTIITNKFFRSLVANDDDNIYSDKVIHNFSGETEKNKSNTKENIIKESYNDDSINNNLFVYTDFKYNLNTDKKIDSFVVVNNPNKNIIQLKLDRMCQFLNSIKDFTIDNNLNKTKTYINEFLMPIIYNCGENLEGNIFMYDSTLVYADIFVNKTKNISNLVLNKNIKNVMEIGFNSGFSALLMLVSNPNLKILCFDIGIHKYTEPCFKKLKETFGDRINIIFGDSKKTLPKNYDTFDLIHVDGGHYNDVATSDIMNSYRLSKHGTILIMDDVDYKILHGLWNEYVLKYNLKTLNINTYDCPYHDIKYICLK